MSEYTKGIFPREGYNLDSAFSATEEDTELDAPVPFESIKTIRTILVGKYKPKVGNGQDQTIEVHVGGIQEDFAYGAADDFNKMPPAKLNHIRGALCTDNKYKFARKSVTARTLTMTATGLDPTGQTALIGGRKVGEKFLIPQDDVSFKKGAGMSSLGEGLVVSCVVTTNATSRGNYAFTIENIAHLGVGYDGAASQKIEIDLVKAKVINAATDATVVLEFPSAVDLNGDFVNAAANDVVEPALFIEKVD